MLREAILNTPLEIGMRSLIVLTRESKSKFDLNRLVIYDYLLVHSGDVENGPYSLHPESPFRYGELTVRRKVIEEGLDFMIRKGLVKKMFDVDGIFYAAENFSHNLINYFESSYAIKLVSRAKWLLRIFDNYTEKELQDYVSSNVGRWGIEFADDPFELDASL